MSSKSVSYFLGIAMVHMASLNKAKAAKSGGRIGGRNFGTKIKKTDKVKNQTKPREILQQPNTVNYRTYMLPPAPLTPIVTYSQFNPITTTSIFIAILIIALLSKPLKK